MHFLSRVKILHKFMAVIALIGVLMGGSIWFAASRMTTIDDAYSRFIVQEARATTSTRRVGRYIFELNYAIYRIIAETDGAQMRLAETRFEQAKPQLAQVLADLRIQAPEFTARVDGLTTDVNAFIASLDDIRTLAMRNANNQALDLFHKSVDPKLNALIDKVVDLSTDIAAFVDKGSDELTNQTHATRRTTMMLSAAALLLGALVAAVVAILGVTRPINALQGAMARLASGDFALDVPGVERRDELGTMAAAVQVFKDNGIRAKMLEEETALARASAAEQRKRAMLDLADGIEEAVSGIVGTLASSSAELQATAQSMTATATQTAAQSVTVAAAAEEASANVSTVAAAAEELGSSVQEIGRQVAGAADLARAAVGEADQTAALVQQLDQVAARIGNVVGLISNIAGQTNLLALNATIEAARAGDAGRGFAVVASEVKELASQTARATEDISTQITQIQAATDQAVTAIGGITARIRDINVVASTIAAAVEEQDAATHEIIRNVTQASAGTSEVTSNISGVAGAAEETGAAANQMLSSASSLSRQSERLGQEMHRFLETVRAA